MKTKLRGAVVGVGYLGTFHAQKYKNNSNVELVGICDFYAPQAEKVAQSLGVQAFAKPEELIGKVDLITIAASTQSHYELASMFINARVHVNIEKPMTATLEQARSIVALAKQKNVKVAVGHIERFNPAIIDLKKHLHETSFIELKRFGPFKARGADVSVLHDLMIHDLDLLTWLTNSEIKSVQASGQKFLTSELDAATAFVELKNGCKALIQVSRVSPTAERSIRVVQKNSILFANTATLEIEKVTAGPDLQTEPLKSEKWVVNKADALQSETDAFIQAVMQGTQTAVTEVDGLVAMENLDLVEKSIGSK
ncbi:MAG: Gfo/Idh/MocA family protein [Bdellovibrionia bacterium]